MGTYVCWNCKSSMERDVGGARPACPLCGARPGPVPQAQAALGLAIAALLLPVVGMAAAVLAVVFGILGLRVPGGWRLAAVVAIPLGALAMLMQVVAVAAVFLLPRPRAGHCAANLRGLGQAIAMYSDENRGHSPHIKPRLSDWRTTWDRDARAGSSVDELAVQANDEGVNIQHWWLLVHSGQVSAGQFVCPDASRTPMQSRRDLRYGFDNWWNVSYALPLATRHESNPSYVMAAGQAGSVVWAADITPHITGATGNHKDRFNYLSASYSVRLHRGDSPRIGFEDDNIFTRNPELGPNDSYLVWREQGKPERGPRSRWEGYRWWWGEFR